VDLPVEHSSVIVSPDGLRLPPIPELAFSSASHPPGFISCSCRASIPMSGLETQRNQLRTAYEPLRILPTNDSRYLIRSFALLCSAAVLCIISGAGHCHAQSSSPQSLCIYSLYIVLICRDEYAATSEGLVDALDA